MKRHQFWNTVPQPVRIVACAIVCVAVLIGLAFGFREGLDAGQLPIWSQPFVGAGLGLLGGGLVAIWFLCLGYIYADARRRAMPPILWTLIAALIPNLLGFLLYFALRQPVLLPCPGCGRPIATEQRFCSWCGERASSPSSQTPLQAPVAPS
jgi:predicted nucleic acid-binding Zn ribbon protein